MGVLVSSDEGTKGEKKILMDVLVGFLRCLLLSYACNKEMYSFYDIIRSCVEQ